MCMHYQTHTHVRTHTEYKEGCPAGCHFWLSFQLSTEAKGQKEKDGRVKEEGWRRVGVETQ